MLLLKNGIKSIFSNWIQVISIFFLLFLSFSLFIGIYNSNLKYEQKFYQIIKKGNLNDFYFSYKDIQEDFSEKNIIDSYLDNENKPLSDFAKDLQKYFPGSTIDEQKSNIYPVNTKIFLINKKKINDNFTFFFINNSSNDVNLSLDYQTLKEIDNSKLNDNDVLINPVFAKLQNIKIGDNLTINNNSLKVKGFAYLPQFCYYDFKSYLFPTYQLQSYIIANDKTIKNISPFTQNFQYCFKVSQKYNSKDFFKKVNGLLKRKGINHLKVTKPFTSKDIFTNIISTRISASRLFTFSVLFIIVLSTEFLIIFFTRRKIELNKQQLGILKSLGYKNYQLIWNYLPFSVSMLIFSFVISLPSLFLINYFIDIVQTSFYAILVPRNALIWWVPVVSFFAIFSIIFILTVFTVYFMLKENVLSMIFGKKNSLLVNRFFLNIFFWKSFKNTKKIFSFNYRLRTAIFLSSLKKNLFVFATSIVSSFLILLSLVGVTFLKSFIDEVNENINYSYSYQLSTTFAKDEKITPSSKKNLYLTDDNDPKYRINLDNKDWDSLRSDIEDRILNKEVFFIKNYNNNFIHDDKNHLYCLNNDCEPIEKIVPVEKYQSYFKAAFDRLVTQPNTYKLCYKCVFENKDKDDLNSLNYIFFYRNNNFNLSLFNNEDKSKVSSFLPKLSLDNTSIEVDTKGIKLNVIATKKFCLTYNLEKGDSLSFKLNKHENITINIKNVVDIQSPVSQIFAIYNHEDLSKLEQIYSYSTIYSHSDVNYQNEYDSYVNLPNSPPGTAIPSFILTISKKDILTAVEKNINFISISFYIFSFFSAIISFFILLSISNLILSENAKLIIILKSFGYKDKEINLLFFTIYFATIIIGIILGVLLNYFVMNFIVNKVSIILKISFSLPFPWWIIFITFIAVIFIFILTFFITKNIIKKLKYYQNQNFH